MPARQQVQTVPLTYINVYRKERSEEPVAFGIVDAFEMAPVYPLPCYLHVRLAERPGLDPRGMTIMGTNFQKSCTRRTLLGFGCGIGATIATQAIGKTLYSLVNPSPTALEDCHAVLYADGELVFQPNKHVDPSREVLHAEAVDLSSPWWVKSQTGLSSNAGDSDDLSASVRRVTSRMPIVASGDLSGLFCGCTNLVDVSGLATWDVSLATDLSAMFCGCSSLADVSAVEGWEPSTSAGIGDMFYGCPAIPPSWYVNPYYDSETSALKAGCFSASRQMDDWSESLVIGDEGDVLSISGTLTAAATEEELHGSNSWTIGPGTFEVPVADWALFSTWAGDDIEYISRDDFCRSESPEVILYLYAGQLVWANVHS